MPRNRFVKPDMVRLDLSDGDWIDVKKELNAGERRAVFANMVKEHHAGEPVLMDSAKVGFTRILAYLVAWSFVDDHGPVALSEAAINNLDTDTYTEIVKALDAHEAQEDAAREARKKFLAGESPSSAAWQSVAS